MKKRLGTKLTLEYLYEAMMKGFKEINRKLDQKPDALSVAKGFNEVHERLDKHEKDINELKTGQAKLEAGQARIERKLGNVVYQWQFEKFKKELKEGKL